jgi:predicted alpha/beta-hydrolase family hydrolase
MKPLVNFLTLLMLIFLTGSLSASDLGKEQRWAEQIVDALLDGEAVYLQADGHEFLGIHTEAYEGDGSQAAIVMHGSGVHPNWPTVVYPLRTRLPEAGWQTLSIQMPVLHNEAEYAEYLPLFPETTPRIRAAIAFLQRNGAQKIVLLAHSLGARMTAYSLASTPQPVAGFAAIGMSGRAGAGNDNSLAHIGDIGIPMLDLFGSQDLPDVVSTAAARRTAGAANPGYRQVEIEGADHFFEGEEEQLLEAVRDWLETL